MSGAFCLRGDRPVDPIVGPFRSEEAVQRAWERFEAVDPGRWRIVRMSSHNAVLARKTAS